MTEKLDGNDWTEIGTVVGTIMKAEVDLLAAERVVEELDAGGFVIARKNAVALPEVVSLPLGGATYAIYERIAGTENYRFTGNRVIPAKTSFSTADDSKH